MKIGIVGYQSSGKSTLFAWLSGTAADPSLAHSGQTAAVEVIDPSVSRHRINPGRDRRFVRVIQVGFIPDLKHDLLYKLVSDG